MIHPNLFPSSARSLLTESQKQVWKTAIRNQPSIVAGYRRTPIEMYKILQTNQLEVFFKFTKAYHEVAFFAMIIFLGLQWRFKSIDFLGIILFGRLLWLIWQHRFGKNTIWNIAVSNKGLSLRNEFNDYVEIPFRQIICIDYKKYYPVHGTHAGELVVYYAYNNNRYFIQKTLLVGNEADTMGIIHYFLNQYQNALPQKP